MFQMIWLDEPIPSCECWEARYESGKWSFGYRVDTPVELTDHIKNPLYIYSHVSNLKLCTADAIYDKGCNICINSLQEYLGYLQKQHDCDMHYREQWLKTHQNMRGTEHLIRVENRNYQHEEMFGKYLVRVQDRDLDHTVFVGV